MKVFLVIRVVVFFALAVVVWLNLFEVDGNDILGWIFMIFTMNAMSELE